MRELNMKDDLPDGLMFVTSYTEDKPHVSISVLDGHAIRFIVEDKMLLIDDWS